MPNYVKLYFKFSAISLIIVSWGFRWVMHLPTLLEQSTVYESIQNSKHYLNISRYIKKFSTYKYVTVKEKIREKKRPP